MTVKDILAVVSNELYIYIEKDDMESCIVVDNKAYMLHGDYINSEVIWLRPMNNGLGIKIK